MMTIRQLYERAVSEGIEIDEIHTRELPAASFPQGWVLIDPSKYETRRAFKCDLAHEIAHCETGSFYNIYSPYDLKAKCERKANKRAAEMLMPLLEVLQAMRSGYNSTWALAEYFDVTEDFVDTALEIYFENIHVSIFKS